MDDPIPLPTRRFLLIAPALSDMLLSVRKVTISWEVAVDVDIGRPRESALSEGARWSQQAATEEAGPDLGRTRDATAADARGCDPIRDSMMPMCC